MIKKPQKHAMLALFVFYLTEKSLRTEGGFTSNTVDTNIDNLPKNQVCLSSIQGLEKLSYPLWMWASLKSSTPASMDRGSQRGFVQIAGKILVEILKMYLKCN